MERLLRYVFNIGTVHFQHHNDVARSDRLIRKYTVTGLLFVTALLLSVQVRYKLHGILIRYLLLTRCLMHGEHDESINKYLTI